MKKKIKKPVMMMESKKHEKDEMKVIKKIAKSVKGKRSCK